VSLSGQGATRLRVSGSAEGTPLVQPVQTERAVRVVSVHGPHALSGVSTWAARVLAARGSRHDWRALVVGTQQEIEQSSPFPGAETGRVSACAWPDDEGAVIERVETIRATLRELAADVVLPNYMPEAYAAAGLESPRGVRAVGICHSHDYWYPELFQHAGALLHGAWAVSESCRSLVEPYLDEELPLLCAPYGSPQPESFNAPPMCGRSQGVIRLLYAGRLESIQKRAERLADLADELERRGVRFELTIAGDGPERVTLDERTRDHQREGRVRLLGAVPFNEMEQLLRDHDMLVLLSAFEGTPLSAIEAMSLGRPVAITEGCGGALDAVRAGGGGAIAPVDDPASMAEEIARVWRSPGALASMGARARAVAVDRFGMTAHIDALEDLIDRAVEHSPHDDGARQRNEWRAIACAAALADGATPERLAGPDGLVRWRSGFLERRAAGGGEQRLDATPPRIKRLGATLLSAAVDELAREGRQRIAVFPAGRHSTRHGFVLQDRSEVACYVDDAAQSGAQRRLHGRPVLTPDAAHDAKIDAIVVSSDQYESVLEKRAREWGGGVPVRTLYVPVRLMIGGEHDA